MDPGASTVTLDGHSLDLPPQMFAAFRMLVEQVGHRDPILKNQEIEERFDREARGVMRDLRKALARCLSADEAAKLVQTVRNRGYRLGLGPSEVTVTG
jgi:DNA-binding response OmpR family regulator